MHPCLARQADRIKVCACSASLPPRSQHARQRAGLPAALHAANLDLAGSTLCVREGV